MRTELLRLVRQVVLVGTVLVVTLGVGWLAALLAGCTEPLAPVPSGLGFSRQPSARTATPGPAHPETFVLVGAGDIADCDRQQDSLTADALERVPGTVFTLGDNAYPNASVQDFERCYEPTWGRPSIKDRTRPTPGDDDYDTPGAAGYFAYFGDAARDPATGYYAYDAGAWRVYVINSSCRQVGGCAEGSAQELWLRADLAANPRECVLAMWHEPHFSSGPKGGSDSMRQMWRVLYDAGAELILNGNHHVYERFAPQSPAGKADPERGIVEFVVGTGGAAPDGFDAPLPNSLVRKARVYGVLRLDLSPTGYAFEYLDVAGRDFSDRGAGECH